MRNDKPTRVGEIVEALARKTLLGSKLEEARIWEIWPSVAGPHLAAHGRPKSVRRGCLHIEVDSVVWMHRFAYRKWDIINELNRVLGRELVTDAFIELVEDEGPMPPQDGV